MPLSEWLSKKSEAANIKEFRAFLRMKGVNVDGYTPEQLKLLLKNQQSPASDQVQQPAEVQQEKQPADPRIAQFREFVRSKGEDDSQLTDEEIAKAIELPTTPVEAIVEQMKKKYADDPNMVPFVNRELDCPALLDKTTGKVHQGFEMFSSENYQEIFGND